MEPQAAPVTSLGLAPSFEVGLGGFWGALVALNSRYPQIKPLDFPKAVTALTTSLRLALVRHRLGVQDPGAQALLPRNTQELGTDYPRRGSACLK